MVEWGRKIMSKRTLPSLPVSILIIIKNQLNDLRRCDFYKVQAISMQRNGESSFRLRSSSQRQEIRYEKFGQTRGCYR